MVPEKGRTYEVECWDEDVMFKFWAKCICEQPLENGDYVFESGGEEIEVNPRDVIREIYAECDA